MTVTAQQHRALLHKQLWEVADSLRGQMNASEFQNYALGVIFYKYLSDRTEIQVKKFINDEYRGYSEAWSDEEDRPEIINHLVKTLGYAIEPIFLYSSMLRQIDLGKQGVWSVDFLQRAFNKTLESTIGAASQHDFEGLFSDVNLTSPTLGRDIQTRSNIMGSVLTSIGKIDFHLEDTEIDVLGDAYEYMIGQFASGAGKKGGEFYTPQQVSSILAKIVANDMPDLSTIYDPTCGSGSLLLRVHKETVKANPDNADIVKMYGQELNTTTYNLARMNLILHGVNWNNFSIRNGDTLKEDLHEGTKFDAIIANPPYSANWEPTELTLQDERFSPYGKLAPKSKADYAFVQTMIAHLNDHGTMAVVLPHGVLFRGAAEGVIRRNLIEKQNVLDAVIGLPANIFYGTTIPTSILVFKKNRKETDDILFIDASNEFEKGKNQNVLTDAHVEKIVHTYTNREAIEKYSKLVKMEEIIANDYNLNIPRYIDTSAEENHVDVLTTKKNIYMIDSLNSNENIEGVSWTQELIKIIKNKRELFTEPYSEIPHGSYLLLKPTDTDRNVVMIIQYKAGDMEQDYKIDVKGAEEYEVYILSEKFDSEDNFMQNVIDILEKEFFFIDFSKKHILGYQPKLIFASNSGLFAWFDGISNTPKNSVYLNIGFDLLYGATDE